MAARQNDPGLTAKEKKKKHKRVGARCRLTPRGAHGPGSLMRSSSRPLQVKVREAEYFRNVLADEVAAMERAGLKVDLW